MSQASMSHNGEEHPIPTVELLRIWENGLHQSLLIKSANLLMAAYPAKSREEIEKWPIGLRDGLLLFLRQQLFGNSLVNTSVCPACSEKVEWGMKTTDFLAEKPAIPPRIPVYKLTASGFEVQFRLPNTQDFSLNLYYDAPLELIRNCVVGAEKDGGAVESIQLPDEVLQQINAQLEELDPQANLTLRLSCPECDHQWLSVFDILDYLWLEIDNWASHLLKEVFILARAFGWSENDILNMSANRRQLYLEMLRS